MRTIDRLMTDTVFDGADGKPSEKTTDWLRNLARLSTVIVADNVATYVHSRNEPTTLEDLPELVLPWPALWIEYRSEGLERRGVIAIDVTDMEATQFSELKQQAIDDAGKEDVRWTICFILNVESKSHNLIGLAGFMMLALGPHGRVVGNRWAHSPLIDPRSQGLDMEPQEWVWAAVLPALQTVGFLHCKNMKLDPVAPPPKLSKKHQKRTGRPLMRYHTLRLELPRRAQQPGARGTGLLGSPGQHIAAGHFAHYGDCHPNPAGGDRCSCNNKLTYARCNRCGMHEPHGKLFGRQEGIYWVPMHVRGNRSEGVVQTDFEVVVPDQ